MRILENSFVLFKITCLTSELYKCNTVSSKAAAKVQKQKSYKFNYLAKSMD